MYPNCATLGSYDDLALANFSNSEYLKNSQESSDLLSCMIYILMGFVDAPDYEEIISKKNKIIPLHCIPLCCYIMKTLRAS